MSYAERVLQRLLSISTKLPSDADTLKDALDGRLYELAEIALELSGGDHASIRLLDGTGFALLCGARAGEGVHKPPAMFDRREGVLGWVVTRGEATLIDDTAADGRFIEKGEQGFGIGSMLAVPMWTGDEVIGVLAVTAKATESFTEDDLRLVELLLNAATPAISLARLLRINAES